nr:MAG TPA: hypothetical protein [Caudoviricetes sp.]
MATNTKQGRRLHCKRKKNLSNEVKLYNCGALGLNRSVVGSLSP